ncbi:DUF6538 domain-containing protein [Bradyrhizobium sp. USDA 4011]
MSRPWKHPKTGIYQLRKVVPDDLRKLVGKREEKLSLQTRDPAEERKFAMPRPWPSSRRDGRTCARARSR